MMTGQGQKPCILPSAGWVWGLWLLSWCLLAAGPADADVRSSLDALLNAEEVRVSAKTLHALGPTVPDLLIEVAADRAEDPLRRTRAIALMKYFPQNQRVSDFLLEAVSHPPDNPVILRSALLALGRQAKAKAVDALAPHLSSSDPLERAAAAKGLAATNDPKAKVLLERAANQEPDIGVKKIMGRLSEKMGSTSDTGAKPSTAAPLEKTR